jgi:hypothetical protein
VHPVHICWHKEKKINKAKADYLIRLLSRYVRVHPVHICWHKEKKSTRQKLTISSDFSLGMLEYILYTFVGIKKKINKAKADYLIRLLSKYVRVHPEHICWHKEKTQQSKS